MNREVNERDWKRFRKRLPDWQEAHMARLLREYADIINSGENPSDRFWQLEKRLQEDKQRPGVVLYNIRRSDFFRMLASLVADGAIGMDDLKDFTEETQEGVRTWLGMY